MIVKRTSFFFSCLIAASVGFGAVAANGQADRTIIDSNQTVKAKREIISLLLKDIFRGERKGSVHLSKKNIPQAILRNFPKFEKLSVQLVAETSDDGPECPLEFSIFEVSGNTALVLFGDCRDGLGYNFEKVGGKWQFAPVAIQRK